MKKITEYKDLNPADFNTSKFPLKNCRVYDGSLWFNACIIGICYDIGSCTKFVFEAEAVGTDQIYFQSAKEPIERYPTDVPEGVAPLPLPYLAYLGIKETIPVSFEGEYWQFNKLYDCDKGTWSPGYTARELHFLQNEHVAIDVSSKFAARNFPDFVEAMG